MNLKDKVKQKLIKRANELEELSPNELGHLQGLVEGVPWGAGGATGGIAGGYLGGKLGGAMAGAVLPPWARGLGVIPGMMAGGLTGASLGGHAGLAAGTQGWPSVEQGYEKALAEFQAQQGR